MLFRSGGGLEIGEDLEVGGGPEVGGGLKVEGLGTERQYRS